MKCLKPFTTQVGAFGCGQCLPCRVQKRRTWTHRILLEAIDHGAANTSFVTLTYDDAHIPADGSLYPEHLTRWLKRLRKNISPRKVRYFAVGEYGDNSGRPHFHSALFGLGPCMLSGLRRQNGVCECPVCSVVRSTWPYGHVMVGRLEAKSAAYIAGYVTKKMTHSSDPRLRGRHPEFARMSLNPGIGALAMDDVASEMLRYRLDEKLVDVPSALRIGSTLMPLGKYLRRRLRTRIGRSENAPKEALQKLANQMQIVRAFAWANDRSVSSVFEELNEVYARNLQAKISLKKRSI